ncbi:MAG: LacI family DNA-binding transcriptional regulator, partial [Verrucomicrobiota bacterium]
MKTPTMTDVAKKAGVSHATVTRSINGRAGVSIATEDRVRQAIADLQYLAPPSHQRPGRSVKPQNPDACKHIALVTFDQALSEHAAFVASIYEGARRAAKELNIAVSLISLDQFDTLPEWVRPGNLDGLLLHGLHSRAHLTRSAHKIPSLWLTTHEEGGINAVLPGNDTAGQIAAQYLIDRNHKHIAAISIDADNPSYQTRIDAFAKTARDQNIKITIRVPRKAKAKANGDPPENPAQAMRAPIRTLAKLKKSNRPTGLFLPSDYMTALAHAACHAEGLNPAESFDFVSCDNEQAFLTGLYPRPATIDLGTETRGRLAVQLLLDRIQNPLLDRKATLTLDPVLVPPPESSGM